MYNSRKPEGEMEGQSAIYCLSHLVGVCITSSLSMPSALTSFSR